jgi:Mor family transcriptional regulator
MGRKGDQRLRQFIDDLVAIGVAELTSDGSIDGAAARALATRIAHRLCFEYGRTQMYIPAVIELELTERDAEIYRKYGDDSPNARRFTHARLRELAAEYNLTERHLYNVLALARRRDIQARQPDLPGLADLAPDGQK